MGINIGIDIGTSTTISATVRDGRPEAADNPEGNKITFSVLCLADEKKPIFGEAAANTSSLKPQYTVTEYKRLMGQQVVAYTHPDSGREYSPSELTAIGLRAVVAYTEEYFGAKVDGAVITVPAYFTDPAREDTKKAAEMAGLKVLKIINEPTAAMLAYLQLHPNLPKGKYAILDLGGGTLDTSIIEVTDGEPRVLTTDGDERLGGTDFTRVIEQLVLEEFK